MDIGSLGLVEAISHGLCLFLCYPYTITMIPFFALIAPNHELPSVWLLTNTIKLSSIPPLIFDAPLLLGISCPLNRGVSQASPGEGIVQRGKYWGSRGHNDSV
jgi:hypothetical protein